MKRWLPAAILAAACTTAAASDLEIDNQSAWDIQNIYISSSDDDDWGPDQLGDDILRSGESVTLMGVRCDTYDFRLVDEDDDTCEIEGVELCDDTTMTITDDALLECEFPDD